ncbi:MAG TPA: hypothetical protein VFR97_03140 [Capillimicrobium sp.]|nr:hypothetical protein [Capillimicrobium sp.]
MLWTIWADVSRAYHDDIVDAGKLPQLLFLLAFLATFGIVRGITHAIRAGRFGLKNVEMGATHVHHLVWGILLLITCGYAAIALDFFPSREVLAVGLGIGVGLTLDEFALWLELRDVYWSPEGRRSIDAVVVTAVFAGLMLVGLHFWVEVARGMETGADWAIASSSALGWVFAGICVLKGKPVTAVVGLFFPIVALIGSIRLATPHSRWAHRYGERKRARASRRFGEERVLEREVRAHL